MDGKHIMVEIPSDSEYNPNTRDPISGQMFFGGRLEYKGRTFLFFRSDDYCDIWEGQTLVDLEVNEAVVLKVWELEYDDYHIWRTVLNMDYFRRRHILSIMLGRVPLLNEEEEE